MDYTYITLVITLAAVAALGTVVAVWAMRNHKTAAKPLPNEWLLAARPVFSTDERRVYRQLREALPHHIVLSKLPLVRFCQPDDPQEVRYWYDLLGSIHVTFAICSANGRVLAAIDLDTDRGNSRRVMHIKQSVLAACRVRYLRCPVDHMPSIPELQLLVPHASGANRAPQPATTSNIHRARDTLSTTVASKRKERTTLWQDSNFFQDSFFAPDSRLDGFGNSEFATVGSSNSSPSSGRNGSSSVQQPERQSPDDIVGVVVDAPRYSTGTRH